MGHAGRAENCTCPQTAQNDAELAAGRTRNTVLTGHYSSPGLTELMWNVHPPQGACRQGPVTRGSAYGKLTRRQRTTGDIIRVIPVNAYQLAHRGR